MSKKSSDKINIVSRTSEQLAKNLAQRIDQKKGNNIVIFDLRCMSPITDYFVIANCLSDVHARTIARELMECETPVHVEGYETAHWILMDYVDVIVHIFMKQTRDFYGLERLWGDAPRIEFEHD